MSPAQVQGCLCFAEYYAKPSSGYSYLILTTVTSQLFQLMKLLKILSWQVIELSETKPKYYNLYPICFLHRLNKECGSRPNE
jgi:hypothetical protein